MAFDTPQLDRVDAFGLRLIKCSDGFQEPFVCETRHFVKGIFLMFQYFFVTVTSIERCNNFLKWYIFGHVNVLKLPEEGLSSVGKHPTGESNFSGSFEILAWSDITI